MTIKIKEMKGNITNVDKETQKLTSWLTKLSEATAEIEQAMKQSLPSEVQREPDIRCLSSTKEYINPPRANANNLDISNLSQPQPKLFKMDSNPYLRMQVGNKSRNATATPKLRFRTTNRRVLKSIDPHKRKY